MPEAYAQECDLVNSWLEIIGHFVNPIPEMGRVSGATRQSF